MSVKNFNIIFPGQNDQVVPRIGHLYAPNNTLAEIVTAGFLNNYVKSEGFSLLPTDFIAAVASDGHQWYKPVKTGTSWQLVVLP